MVLRDTSDYYRIGALNTSYIELGGTRARLADHRVCNIIEVCSVQTLSRVVLKGAFVYRLSGSLKRRIRDRISDLYSTKV